MHIIVARNSFFKAPTGGGSLRFTEQSPIVPLDTEDHSVCGCTKTTTTRPDGEPFEVKQSVIFRIDMEGGKHPYDIQLHVGEGGAVGFTVYWPQTSPPHPPRVHQLEGLRFDHPEKAHAYFWLRADQQSLQVEVTGTGDNGPHIDCFLGTLFFGNKVDTSHLMNGHSPSRIIDLSKLNEDDVWVHDCHYGAEALSLLTPNIETKAWQRFRERLVAMESMLRPQVMDRGPVEAIRESLLKDMTTPGIFVEEAAFLIQILECFTETELCAKVREVRAAVHPNRISQ